MQITESIVDDIVVLAGDASALLREYFNTAMAVNFKEDHSPVTKADTDANQLIVERLARITPTIPIIAEESCNSAEIPPRFWLVDPLDGTRALVKGVPEFSVNIGFIENNTAVFGVLAIPMRNEIYLGGTSIAAQKIFADGSRKKIRTRTPPIDGLHVVKSASYPSAKMQAYLDTFKTSKVEGLSSALKFALVAEGSADIYPRFGRTMEWDTAAGQAILEAAGGSVCTVEGAPFRYGKPNYENAVFIAKGWRVC